jgi:regulation of enolase protein 1 (concanavalin A-like superfamily)
MASTDFWRVTGEGVDAVRDNGHLYGEIVVGDFDLSVEVRGDYGAQYDQAGVMVRVDDRQWFKTGIEFLDGIPRYSTVVTFEYSNWSIAEVPTSFDHVGIRLSCRGNAVEVHRTIDDGPEEFCAHLYVAPERAKLVGVMCAAPKGAGFEASFRNLVLTPVTEPS